MDSESDVESSTPLNIAESANIIPEISKEKYMNAYNVFIKWCEERNTNSFGENVLLDYISYLSEKYKPSTLWSHYSMLRTTITINKNVDIATYSKLRAFLKRQSTGYRVKKSKIFSTEEINKFIKEARDEDYLLAKAVLIVGIMGSCRRDELYKMKITDVKDLDSAYIIEIPNTKTKLVRKFTITGQFYELVKRYISLRPQNAQETLFLNYVKGKCTVQRVGINKFGILGKQIAEYLKLPNPKLYTGHCFRRSSATVRIDNGEDVASLKRYGEWKPSTLAEGYIDDTNMPSSSKKEKVDNTITPFIPKDLYEPEVEDNELLSPSRSDYSESSCTSREFVPCEVKLENGNSGYEIENEPTVFNEVADIFDEQPINNKKDYIDTFLTYIGEKIKRITDVKILDDLEIEIQESVNTAYKKFINKHK